MTIDEIHKQLLRKGLRRKDVDLVLGMFAEHGQESYKQGYDIGFKSGIDWKKKNESENNKEAIT